VGFAPQSLNRGSQVGAGQSGEKSDGIKEIGFSGGIGSQNDHERIEVYTEPLKCLKAIDLDTGQH
jgi:hypothetical protein